jgi:hypothetical protein
MPATYRVPRAPVTYQPTPTVERALRLRLGCRSEGAAHQRLLRLRRENAIALECFLEARAPDRLTWYIEPSEKVLSRQPVPELTQDLVATAVRIDGREDGALGELQAHLEDPIVGRSTLREILHEITAKQRLARAISARHGWTP